MVVQQHRDQTVMAVSYKASTVLARQTIEDLVVVAQVCFGLYEREEVLFEYLNLVQSENLLGFGVDVD